MILSAHTSNGGPHIARPAPLTTRRMLKLLRKRLDQVALKELSRKQGSVRKVHRLRVATRKALAALTVCRPLLMKSDVRSLEKLLKAQRKALGPVRDWDVLISRVLCSPADEKADLRCDLLLYLATERERAWRAAQKAWPQAADDANCLIDKKGKLVLRGDAKDTAHELFHRAIREPLTTIRQGMPNIDGSNVIDMKALHQFRIACKALRYLLEYRDDVTGPPTDSFTTSKATELLAEAQQQLGDLHDLTQRPRLLGSGRRAVSKEVRKWLETASEKAELRVSIEFQRYLTWQAGANIDDAFRALDN